MLGMAELQCELSMGMSNDFEQAVIHIFLILLCCIQIGFLFENFCFKDEKINDLYEKMKENMYFKNQPIRSSLVLDMVILKDSYKISAILIYCY